MESLAKAIWRAKTARQTPTVVVTGYQQLLDSANRKIAELEKLNAELKGRIGGLMARPQLRRTQEDAPNFLTISQVADAVSREFGIALIDMQSERRTREATLPRQVAMYLSRKLTNRSYPVIANFFGKRDHTTAMHSFTKIEARRIEDSDLDAKIEGVEQFLVGIQKKNDTPAMVPTESVQAPFSQSALAERT